MQLSSTTLSRVIEFSDFNSTVQVIPPQYTEVLDIKIDIVAPDEFNLGLTEIEDRDNLLVGLQGKYTGIFDTEIWYFKEGDVVGLDYSKGAGDPELISEVKFQELKDKYPDLPVSQPVETNNYLNIPEGQTLAAYIQSSNLTKTISYTVTVDYAEYLNDLDALPDPILPSDEILPDEIELIKEGYNIDDYNTPPPLVIREILNLSQTVDGDTSTAKRVINSYYSSN
jgi:hypothetical protein